MKFFKPILITLSLSLLAGTALASPVITLSDNQQIAPNPEVNVSVNSLKPGMQNIVRMPHIVWIPRLS